ncbi:MAG TPA: hypothetical protein VEY30_09405, partial [Myxococcaceae bacterium]|nr:hypothetical protein [Myxococcaceae bacterium]
EDSQDGKGQDEHAISGAAVGNGVIVTVGDGGALVSTDGKTWTRIEALPRWPQLHSSKVAFADGRFIVVGNGGTWTSPDGMAWVGVTGDAALPGGDADGNPIPGGFSGHVGAWAAGDGKVLFTNDNALYRLFDGARWYQAKLGNYAGWLNSAAFGNGRFVMTGETCCNMQSPTSGGLRTASTDGRTWPTIITNESGEYLSFGNLVWDGTRFYAASGTDALVSQDGLTWSQVAMSANLREATFFEGTYYGTDGRHIYTSADGRAWTRIYEGAEGSWYLGTLVVGRILK